MTALTDGEKDGGLAAVALTIGEAKVKGTEGGEEGTGGSCRGDTGYKRITMVTSTLIWRICLWAHLRDIDTLPLQSDPNVYSPSW